MINMKSKVIIIVLIVVIVAVLLIALLMNKKSATSGSGDVKGTSSSSITRNWDDGYVPSIPEGYTQISKDKITNETDVVAEAIAYHYDSGEKITYVNVYLQNRGEEPLNKDAICDIELFEANGASYRFGGVIENGVDVQTAGRSVVRTQFIEKTNELVSAKISIIAPKVEEAPEEVVEPEGVAPVESEEPTSVANA